MTVRMVVVNKLGVVHDLATTRHCSSMISLRREFKEGRERYAPVKGIQALAYKLPGCNDCFGSEAAFKYYLQSATSSS